MTNEELAQAIDMADEMIRLTSTESKRFEPWLEHLKALLTEQRRRAEQRLELSSPLANAKDQRLPATDSPT